MIIVINHLFDTKLVRDNFYLSQYKYFIFETNDIETVKILILARLMNNYDIYNVDFQLNFIDNIQNIAKPYMFISKYQILWDKIFMNIYAEDN